MFVSSGKNYKFAFAYEAYGFSTEIPEEHDVKIPQERNDNTANFLYIKCLSSSVG